MNVVGVSVTLVVTVAIATYLRTRITGNHFKKCKECLIKGSRVRWPVRLELAFVRLFRGCKKNQLVAKLISCELSAVAAARSPLSLKRWESEWGTRNLGKTGDASAPSKVARAARR